MSLKALLAVTALLALAGCGGGASTSTASTPAPTGTASPQVVTITENEFALTPKTVAVKPGVVTFQLSDTGKFPHDLHVVDSAGTEVGATSKALAAGSSDSLTVTLKAGTYTMYCAVDSHRQRGMEGTITVQ